MQHRERVATYFDPLPIWYEPFEGANLQSSPARRREPIPISPTTLIPLRGDDGHGVKRFPLHAITQRPMFMYHAWGSQNAWLRQIAARNWLYLHPDTGARARHRRRATGSTSNRTTARITVQAKFAANVQPDTVWTWNAIGKRRGAWKLAKDAPEGERDSCSIT